MVTTAPVRHRRNEQPVPLRLTRRGRVVVVALLVLLALSASVVLFTRASRAADPVGPPRTVVVQPYDTLWSIAARTAPGRDPYAVVAEIKRLNGRVDHVIHSGETLVVPAGH